MNQESEKIDLEKHADELASLKRVVVQFDGLRKWLLNVCLASLAFAFTAIFQIKGDDPIPHPYLAGATIILFIASAAGSFYIRAKNEVEKFVMDSKSVAKLLPFLNTIVISAPELSREEKDKISSWLKLGINNDGDGSNYIGYPFLEAIFIGINILLLLSGYICLCVYLWFYLFAK